MRVSTLVTHKSFLRDKLRRVLGAISLRNCRLKSTKIVRVLLKSTEFRNARSMVAYLAKPGEVETRGLIRKALSLKKAVYAPRIDLKSRRIDLFRISQLSKDLKRGPYGIWEPKRTKGRRGNPAKMDLVIVPGLAFDRKGRRLGRGGGFFDRFLRRAKTAKKIGLAFREQKIRRVPAGRRDVLMDRVITD